MSSENNTFASTKEQWRLVVGMPSHQVSNLGRVRSLYCGNRWGSVIKRKSPLVMSQTVSDEGYLRITLMSGGRIKTMQVHALVAEAFIGKRPEGMEINHKDGRKLNNLPSNLEYVTPSKNMLHAYENGLKKRMAGSSNPNAVLTPEEVEVIRELLAAGVKVAMIAHEFSVCKGTVSNIKFGRTWTDKV